MSPIQEARDTLRCAVAHAEHGSIVHRATFDAAFVSIVGKSLDDVGKYAERVATFYEDVSA